MYWVNKFKTVFRNIFWDSKKLSKIFWLKATFRYVSYFNNVIKVPQPNKILLQSYLGKNLIIGHFEQINLALVCCKVSLCRYYWLLEKALANRNRCWQHRRPWNERGERRKSKYWKVEASSIAKFPESYSQTMAEKTLNLLGWYCWLMF